MPNTTNPAELKNKTQDLARQGKDLASQAVDKGKDLTSQALDAGRSAAHNAGHAAEQATGRVGDSVKALGQAVREHGPREGVLGQGKEWVADALEGGGSYLSEQGLKGVGDSLTKMVKDNPIPALLVGIGFGFLLARVVRS